MEVLLFFLGTILGSFLNVVALRYDPDRFLFHPKVIGGRSRCPRCGKTLRWFELVPLLSFIVQRRKCRHCGGKISWRYPAIEIITGFIVALVPQFLAANAIWLLGDFSFCAVLLSQAIWTLAFLFLLLISLIDLRLKLIPDEAIIVIICLAIAWMLVSQSSFGFSSGSFVKAYAPLFGLRGNIYINHFIGALAASLFFFLIAFLSRGRAIGMGDVKLAFALGLIFGWPDIVLSLFFSFVTGSLAGLFLILSGKTGLKGLLPFGPFLALGSALVFFVGFEALNAYFKLFGIL